MNVALNISWEFHIDESVEFPNELHDLGERVMQELLKLEDCNQGVHDSGTATDADRNVITIDLLVHGAGLEATLHKMLGVVRSALHGAGCATPEWPTAEEVAVMLRPGEMTATPERVPELV